MTSSIVDLLARQRMRVDHLAQVAGRFVDEPTKTALVRLSGRLDRLAATMAAPSARLGDVRHRIDGHLERLVRDVGQLRIDDPVAIARVTWVLAEMEEALRPEPGQGLMPVYTAGR